MGDKDTHESEGRENLVPAAAVIPVPQVYILGVAVKKFVVCVVSFFGWLEKSG